VSVIVRRPGPPLDGLIQAITYRAGEQPRTSVEKILPGASTSLWINLNRDEFRSFGEGVRSVPGAMLAGPSSRATVIEFEQGHAHLSVTFVLGGASGFFAAPLTLARDKMVPLAFVWGPHGAQLREQVMLADTPGGMLHVLEDALIKQLTGPLTPDPAMVEAARALSGGVSVAGVADSLGLLPRTLRRRFTASVGLTPKRFARVQRLQRVVRSLDGRTEVDWAAIAACHGYADQPHLADEFRELADVTPGEYLRFRVDGPNHLSLPGTASSTG
jgi:AraC-like DNA-binding protein